MRFQLGCQHDVFHLKLASPRYYRAANAMLANHYISGVDTRTPAGGALHHDVASRATSFLAIGVAPLARQALHTARHRHGRNERLAAASRQAARPAGQSIVRVRASQPRIARAATSAVRRL